MIDLTYLSISTLLSPLQAKSLVRILKFIAQLICIYSDLIFFFLDTEAHNSEMPQLAATEIPFSALFMELLYDSVRFY